MRSSSLVVASLFAAGAALSCGGSDSPATSDSATPDTAVNDTATDTVTVDTVSDSSPPDAETGGGSATWTLVPNPTCTSTGVAIACVDTGALVGYQLTAIAPCPLNNILQIFLPGGSKPPAGTYTVKPVKSIFDIVNLTAGQVVVDVTYHPNISTQEEWFAQSGSVIVTNTGGKIGYSMTDLPTKKYGIGTATTLTATASCP